MSGHALSSLAREVLDDLASSWRPRIGCDGWGNPDPSEVRQMAFQLGVSPTELTAAILELREKNFLVPRTFGFEGIQATGWLEANL
jgi:hypothetical protein